MPSEVAGSSKYQVRSLICAYRMASQDQTKLYTFKTRSGPGKEKPFLMSKNLIWEIFLKDLQQFLSRVLYILSRGLWGIGYRRLG